jgi:hypothetical protein
MKKRKPLTDENGEVRELMQGDYHDAKPFSMLSAYLQLKLTSLRGRTLKVNCHGQNEMPK